MKNLKSNKITRALVSVSDKKDLIKLGTFLIENGVEILSTGGSAKYLLDAGVPVKEVSKHTGFPEIMGGRVKTLHPKIHGGILARRSESSHLTALDKHAIDPIDMIVVNLYPFEETVSGGANFDTCIENIDIGGPSLIRAAAKNHESVTVVTDPKDYDAIINSMSENQGATTPQLRRQLAAAAYAKTAAYDAAISGWFAQQAGDEFPKLHTLVGTRTQVMRYGENPHQAAAFYRTSNNHFGVGTAKQLQGKELSFNNIADTDAALECIKSFDEPACVIVKHANPCGVAIAKTSLEAYERAFRTDPTSAFGGIIALNRELDGETAARITEQQFTEVIIAPLVSEEALEITRRKKNVRVLACGDWPKKRSDELDFRRVSGGILVQSKDIHSVTLEDLQIVTKRKPTQTEIRDLLFAWQVAQYVKSNAIVYCKNKQTIGIGAGQMSRVYSAKIAGIKASDENLIVKGSVMASDAFFPFRDGIDAAAAAGITAVIQPGGSMLDTEVIAAADEAKMAMAFTGIRHFRH